jgi:hypothetical protein
MMKTKIVLSAVLVAIASAAHADEKRVELGINLGYTGSSGIDSNEVAPSGQAGVFVSGQRAPLLGRRPRYFASEKVQIMRCSSQKSDQPTGAFPSL